MESVITLREQYTLPADRLWPHIVSLASPLYRHDGLYRLHGGPRDDAKQGQRFRLGRTLFGIPIPLNHRDVSILHRDDPSHVLEYEEFHFALGITRTRRELHPGANGATEIAESIRIAMGPWSWLMSFRFRSVARGRHRALRRLLGNTND